MRLFRNLIVVLLALSSCYNCNIYKQEAFRGRIEEIFEDDRNHYQTTYLIKTNDQKFEFIGQNFPNSWEYAQKGDSIVKLMDSLKIEIIKPNGEHKYFNCARK